MVRRSLALAVLAAVVVALAPAAQAEDEWVKAWKEGKHHFLFKDYPQALAAWERSSKLNPRELSTYSNMAKCLTYMKRYGEAVPYFDKALSLGVRGERAGNIWGDKGVCLRHLKKYSKAIEAYKKAQELEPKQYLHWHAMGNAYSDIGHSEDAIAAWKKSLELNPDDRETEEAIETEQLKLARESRPFASTVPEIAAARERAAELDLDGALEALGDGDRAADPLKSEVAEIEARRAYLDAIGAAATPGTIVIALEAGKRAKLVSASSKGVQVDGVDAVVPWHALPRGTAVALISATEKTVKTPPLGAALVLYDVGLWPQGDQRTKAWVDSEPASAAKAEAIVARYRGLAEAPQSGFLWKNNEWLTPEEDDARTHDTVVVDGKAISREDARKLAERQRAERKIARRSQVAEAKARSEKLLTEHGVTEVKTILSSGDPLKRADVVVVADGFTSAELPTFERLADSIAKTVLTIEPFKNYSRYVNVHRVTVVAEQSGILGSRVGAKVGSNKTLTCDRDLARRYGQFAPDADLVIVCANVKDVRATGGHGVITMDVSGEFGEVVLHELGHAFAALDDEYADATSVEGHPDYEAAQERFHINSTRESNPKKSKWAYWLLPPALPKDQEVGCFAGSYYRDKGYYRPCQNCRMKSESLKKYCPVCLEQMEKSFYSRIEPIDDTSVRAPDVDLYKDDALKLDATAIAISAEAKLGGFSARWYVDDKPALPAAVKSAGVKTELTLKALNLPPGPHEALLRVDLKDTRVRRDGGLLSSLRAWRVNVADAPRPKIGMPDKVAAARGELVSFDITLDGGTPDQRLDVDGPGGSSFVQTADRSGRFFWCPPRNARGLYHVEVTIGYGETQIRRTTDILIQDPAHNVPPVLRDQGLLLATRGQPLVLRLETFDADGDGLIYSVKKLPPGATLNTSLGILRWTPGYSTPFDADSEIVVKVSDGLSEDELAFKVKVANRPIEGSGPAFDVLQATRSTSAEVRKEAVGALLESDLPRGGKLLELARLLRDPDPDVSKIAGEQLATALEYSEKSTRGLVAIDLADHVWDFADRPLVLAFLRDFLRYLFNPEADAAVAKLQKDLAAVEAYNKDRGAP